jgi:lipoprotein-releasing system permease protein
MYKLFMAFRYLRAHKIIYFSIAGVALGIMTLVVVTSIMSGFAHDMRERIRGLQSHLVITSPDRSLWMTDYEEIAEEVRKAPHVRGCAPRIEYDAWLGKGGVRRDCRFVGILPERERGVSDLEKYFQDGGKERFDFNHDTGAAPERPGVVVGGGVVGGGISRTVGLMTARDATGLVGCVKDFEEVGRFKSGMAEYDTTYVFMHLSAAQEFLKFERPSANVLAVAVDDYAAHGDETRKAVLDAIHARKPCSFPDMHGAPATFGGSRCGLYRVVTWEQVKATLLAAVEVEKRLMMIVLFFIVVVACFNISAIYTLVIRAKSRDIGILRALGGTEGGVVSIFLTSGMLCGLIGSAFGVGLGLLFSFNVNEIEDFVRVVSREVNGMPPAMRQFAAVALAASIFGVVWCWTAFYKERRPFPWVRVGITGLLLAGAAWYSTSWQTDPRFLGGADPPSPRTSAVVWTLVTWAILAAGWGAMRRWRRRPAWIFFGFAWTFFFGAVLLAAAAMKGIVGSILATNPGPGWRGLELFSREIYFLDDIPVFVDYGGIALIVALSLVVSLIFSVYPALRAASCNPIEAIRDE